ncbi:MAG TPA: hypothetical protein VEA41_18845 [Salinarimonas sp.]|nr:hypothetical protein [Salinarimonas sp.]
MKSVFGYLKKNWKTSLAGVTVILSAVPNVGDIVGTVTNTIIESNPQSKSDWLGVAVKVAIGVGLMSAKDANVSGK